MQHSKKERLIVRVDAKQLEDVKRMSEHTGLSVSDIVRQAVDRELKRMSRSKLDESRKL